MTIRDNEDENITKSNITKSNITNVAGTVGSVDVSLDIEYDYELTSVATTVLTSETDKPKQMEASIPAVTTYRKKTPARTENHSSGNWVTCLFCTICLGGIVGIIAIIVSAASEGGGSGSGNGGGGGGSAWYYSGSGSSGRSGGSCFPAGELVQLEFDPNLQRGSDKVPVEDLRPGSISKEGGMVTAVFKLLPSDQEILYRYNHSAWVTGMHSVFEGVQGSQNSQDGASGQRSNQGEALTYVKDSELASIGPTGHFWETSSDYLYNVVTERHRVVINGTLFSDWEEQDFCSKYLLRRLNSPNGAIDVDEGDLLCSAEEIDEDPLDPIDEGSFVAGTMISIGSTAVPIEILEAGDLIEGGMVLAVVQIYQQSGGFVYRHYPSGLPNSTEIGSEIGSGHNTDFVEATKWTIVRDSDGKWRYIQDSVDAVHHRVLGDDGHDEGGLGEVFYQLITSSHRIVSASGSVYSDYEVFDDDAVASSSSGNQDLGLGRSLRGNLR